jgi:hypothetical protein
LHYSIVPALSSPPFHNSIIPLFRNSVPLNTYQHAQAQTAMYDSKDMTIENR